MIPDAMESVMRDYASVIRHDQLQRAIIALLKEGYSSRQIIRMTSDYSQYGKYTEHLLTNNMAREKLSETQRDIIDIVVNAICSYTSRGNRCKKCGYEN